MGTWGFFRRISGDTPDWIPAREVSQRTLGDARIVAMIERTLNLPAAFRPHGRPGGLSIAPVPFFPSTYVRHA